MASSHLVGAPEAAPRPARLRLGDGTMAAIWLACLVSTTWLVLSVHPHAMLGYGYYLVLGLAVMLAFDRAEGRDFVSAYLGNALLTALYVFIQVRFYPESYGCTSPLGAQTDDSFFFSLVADVIPPGMATRPEYDQYHYGFTTIVRWVTPFAVTRPLDVLFFMSGIAGLVCVYTKQLAYLQTGDRRAARLAYFLALFCPMMLMNGGAVFVRDTFVAALLVLSFCCLYRRRYLAFGFCFALQLVLRPGTAFIVLILYLIMFVENLGVLVRTRARRMALLGALVIIGLVVPAATYLNWGWVDGQLQKNGIVLSELRREGQDETLAGGFGKGTFTRIQSQPLVPRVALSTAYMFLGPFLNPSNLVTADGFDTRILLMNVVYPLWVLPVYAWFFAAAFARKEFRSALRRWVVMFLVACFLIGVFSLQSRHRVAVQPLFYAIAASGAMTAPPRVRMAGFGLAGLWIIAQLAYLCFF